MTKPRWRIAVAGLAMVGNAASAAPASCIPAHEAEAVIARTLPLMLNGIGARCASVLPPTAMLRANLSNLIARYATEGKTISDAEGARAAKVPRMSTMEQTLLLTIAVGSIGQRIKPSECAKVEEAVRLLSPLPTINLVSLLRLILSGEGEPEERIRICEARQP